MKRILFTSFVLLSVFMISCKPTLDQAIEHNDAIVADQKSLLSMEDELLDLISNGSPASDVSAKFASYSDFITTSLKKYEDMSAFDDKDVFRIAMVDFLKAFQTSGTEKMGKVVEMYAKGFEQFTEDDDATFDQLAVDIDEIENKALEMFIAKQDEFSKDYGFTLK